MEQTVSQTSARRPELEALFVSALPDVERAIRFVARRHRLSRTEEDDFAGEVKLALVENDYDVFARFQGRSSLRTYLTTVVQRLFLDHRCKLWGKWRPSAEAQRRGPVALRLEVLLYRDGLTFDEAAETLRTNFGITETREELSELLHALPVRGNRRAAGEELLASVPAGELANPEVLAEGAATADRVQTLLEEVIEALTPQERLVLRLRFEDDVSIADIARMLELDQKQLYRRIESLLASFRKSLEDRRLGWPEVSQMIERGQCHLRLPKKGAETGSLRPSPSEGQA